jgi:hypothetical protein
MAVAVARVHVQMAQQLRQQLVLMVAAQVALHLLQR